MSDLEEMRKELKRAVELGDMKAAARIAACMIEEVANLGFADAAEELARCTEDGDWLAIITTINGIARHAAEIDRARGEIMGEGYDLGAFAVDLGTMLAQS